MLQELISAVDRATGAANTKRESKILPKHFIGAGKLSNIKALNIHLPSLLDGSNFWDVASDPPGRREYPAFVKKTGLRPDIVV